MQTFETARDAKEFLVNTVIAEARLEGAPLSKLESDMLYFTESAWCPLDDCVATNEAFEREYDTEEYEQRIASLVRNFCARSRKENLLDLEAWEQAVRKINGEDHYLLVMVKAANRGAGSTGHIPWLLIFLGVFVAAILLSFAIVLLRLM